MDDKLDDRFATIDVHLTLKDRIDIRHTDLREISNALRRRHGWLGGDDGFTDDAILDALNAWVEARSPRDLMVVGNLSWDSPVKLDTFYEAVRAAPPLEIVGQLDLEGNMYLGAHPTSRSV